LLCFVSLSPAFKASIDAMALQSSRFLRALSAFAVKVDRKDAKSAKGSRMILLKKQELGELYSFELKAWLIF